MSAEVHTAAGEKGGDSALVCIKDDPQGGAFLTPYREASRSHGQAGVKEIGAQLRTSNHNSKKPAQRRRGRG